MNCISNKCTYLYPRNNGDTIGTQQSIKNKIRYKSDQSGDAINLSKLSFSSDAFKLLNKNLKFVHTLKKYNKKQLEIPMLKIPSALSNFELTSRITIQSQTQIKKSYPSK